MTDLFPAIVSVYPSSFVDGLVSPYSSIGFGDESAVRFTDCRVIVHNNLVIVGADTPRGAQAVFKDEVSAVFVDKPFTRVLTVSGRLVVFGKSKGCGCGSRLRSWNPYGNIVGSSRG